MRFFRNRAFAAANAASLLMFFGMFGSIFLLTQYLQNVQGNSPLEAGLRMLPWTGMPMIVAPIAGAVTDRIGGRPLLVAGLALQATALAWLAAITAPDVAYIDLVPPFAIAGVGMALFFAPVATVVLGAVGPREAGKASGANNAIRELGGVFGVAVLASIFTHQGGYGSAALFTDGIIPALWVGAAVVTVGAFVAVLLPGRQARMSGSASPRFGEPSRLADPAAGASGDPHRLHAQCRIAARPSAAPRGLCAGPSTGVMSAPLCRARSIRSSARSRSGQRLGAGFSPSSQRWSCSASISRCFTCP